MRITAAPDIGSGSINIVPSAFGTRTAGTGFARKFGAKRRISQGEFISPVVIKSGAPIGAKRSGSNGDIPKTVSFGATKETVVGNTSPSGRAESNPAERHGWRVKDTAPYEGHRRAEVVTPYEEHGPMWASGPTGCEGTPCGAIDKRNGGWEYVPGRRRAGSSRPTKGRLTGVQRASPPHPPPTGVPSPQGGRLRTAGGRQPAH